MLLERYKDRQAVFNDDIQGTGAVTLATLQAAVGVTNSTLSDQRIVIFGAGTAGMGIARQIRDAMVLQDGTDEREAAAKFWLVDKLGLIHEGLGGEIRDGVDREFVRDEEEDRLDLEEVVRRVKPTVLIGTSTQAGAFTVSRNRLTRRLALILCAGIDRKGNVKACRPADHFPGKFRFATPSNELTIWAALESNQTLRVQVSSYRSRSYCR